MGVDLRIYPVLNGSTSSFEMLEFDRDYDDFELFETLDRLDFNHGLGLNCHLSDGFMNVKSDAYDQSLRFVNVYEIMKLKGLMSGKNGAIINYLSELNNYIFVLYWH